MKVVFYIRGILEKSHVCAVHWQEPGGIVADIYDNDGDIFTKKYPDKSLRDVANDSGGRMEALSAEVKSLKVAKSYLGKHADLVAKLPRVDL